MDATFGSGYTDRFTGAARIATRADATVADHSRSLDGQSVVMRPDADRDDANMAGHRVTELSVSDCYVHRHSPDSFEVIPFADTPLGDVA